MMFKSKPKININTHRIIREQIERSLKSVRNKRLVQVLGAVLQISHIRKCVLSEAQIKNPKHQHILTHIHTDNVRE